MVSSNADSSHKAEHPSTHDVVIIGAGPAGLTAAYELNKRGETSTVLEADSVVGGISRSAERDGWRFDIGGHRFFTKVGEVERIWHEILPAGGLPAPAPHEPHLLQRQILRLPPPRHRTRCAVSAIVEATLCVLSYVWARIRPPKDMDSFEGWTASRFGWRLYRTFFKTYTEKVWGVPASEIQADWAAQRIKNLSLFKAVVNAMLPKRNQRDITSLIEEFQYPKYGPGMMWERCRDIVEERGTKVIMNTGVTRVHHEGGRAVAVDGRDRWRTHSLPLHRCRLVHAHQPACSRRWIRRCRRPYRLRRTGSATATSSPSPWSSPSPRGSPTTGSTCTRPDVHLGRIQNFGSWSPYLVKEGRTCLGLEYFVFEGDHLWVMPDEELVELATRELQTIGLIKPGQVEAGYVVRMPKAYPMYDDTYKANVAVLREWLAGNAPNVWPVGRNGMHKYNNQDHSMYTALLTVENILGADHDIWSVNVEEEYHEQKAADGAEHEGSGRDAPVLNREVVDAARQARTPA